MSLGSAFIRNPLPDVPAFTPGSCGSPGVLTKVGPVYARQDVHEDRIIFNSPCGAVRTDLVSVKPGSLSFRCHRAEPLATRWSWLFAVAG